MIPCGRGVAACRSDALTSFLGDNLLRSQVVSVDVAMVRKVDSGVYNRIAVYRNLSCTAANKKTTSMIASVVVTLSDNATTLSNTLVDIKSAPQIEAGEFADESRRIPMTIDSSSRNDIEAVTRWLQDRPGVLFVDVVFVHFEDSDESSSGITDSKRRSRSNRQTI